MEGAFTVSPGVNIPESVNGPIAAGVPGIDPRLMLSIEGGRTPNGDETGSGGRIVGPGSEGVCMTGGDKVAGAPATRFACDGTAVASILGEDGSFIRDAGCC